MNKVIFSICGPLLFRIFLRMGKLFYNKIALHGSGRAAHFSYTEWDMVNSMNEYLDEEDFITNDQPQ